VAAFGVDTVTAMLKPKRESYINFVRTHLWACVKEQYLSLVIELLQSIYNKTEPGLAISLTELDAIIHFKPNSGDSFAPKTALALAVEQGDLFTVLELLKLEHDFHQQCCQVLKRLLRQLNENLPLSDKKPPLIQIFKKSATFPLFLASTFALTLEN
jgi:hypothetical protein